MGQLGWGVESQHLVFVVVEEGVLQLSPFRVEVEVGGEGQFLLWRLGPGSVEVEKGSLVGF